MVGKRGIIRIVEATIAMLIIIGVVIVVVANRNARQETDISSMLPPLLAEISRNASLREIIVSNPSNGEQEVLSFLSARIRNPAFSYSARICGPDEICGLENYPKTAREIYSDERIISSTLQSYGPKKVKIFLWEVKG